jgi:hypothetical protein
MMEKLTIDRDEAESRQSTSTSFGDNAEPQQTIFISSLEGLRGLATLFTMVSHIMEKPVGARETLGMEGVTVFFVISGYLITGVLLRLQVRVNPLALRGHFRKLIVSHSQAPVRATIDMLSASTLTEQSD